MLSAARPGLVVASCLLAACGSRSQLDRGDFDGAGGAGVGVGGAAPTGGAGGGVVGGGGAGGQGGGPLPSCGGLAQPLAVLAVAAGPADEQRRPRFIYASGDGQTVALLSGWRVAQFPTAPFDLRHTSFRPWAAWPSGGALSPSFLIAFDRGGSFEPAAAGDGFAALSSGWRPPPEPPPGVFFTAGLKADSGEIGTSFEVDPLGRRAVFASRLASRTLVGVARRAATGRWSSHYTVVSQGGGGPSTSGLAALACDGRSAAADAAPSGAGWLVAAASRGALPQSCPAPAGAATQISMARISIDGGLRQTGFIAVDSTVARIRTAVAAEDGMWIVYNEEIPGFPLSVARVDAAGLVAMGPTKLPGGVAGRDFGVAAFGAELVVAYSVGNRIEVRVVDEAGQVTAASTLDRSALAGIVDEQVAVIGSPDQRSFLVAWSESVAGVSNVKKIRLTRYQCQLLQP